MSSEKLTMFKNIDNDEEEAILISRIRMRNSTETLSNNPIIKTSLNSYDSKLIENVNSVIAIVQPNPNNFNQNNVNAINVKMSSQKNDTQEKKISSLNEVSSSTSLTTLQSSSNTSISNESNRYNISNVLKHIYALKYNNKTVNNSNIDLSNNQTASSNETLNKTSSSTSKQFWMPDEQVKECFQCNEKFTTFRRRHHCRVCGQIFCGKCSDYEIPSQLIFPNTTGNIRACTFCNSFVGQMETGDIKNNSKSIKELMSRLSLPTSTFYAFASGSGSNSELEQANLKSNVENQSVSNLSQMSSYGSSSSLASLTSSSNLSQVISSNLTSSINNLSTLNPQVSNTISASSSGLDVSSDENNPFDVTENKDYFKSQDLEIKQLIINNSSELRNLWVQLYHTSDGVQFATKKINKFKSIYNCITGRELVDWLMKSKSVSKDQAIVIGQALMHGKWLECAYQNNPNSSSINSLSSYYLTSNNPNKVEQIYYDDNTFYKPGPTAFSYNRNDNLEQDKKKNVQDTDEGPEWIKELNKLIPEESSSNNNLNTVNNILEASSSSSNTNVLDSQSNPIPIIKIQNKALILDEAQLVLNQTIISSGTSSLSSSPNQSNNQLLIQQQLPERTLNNVNDNLQQIHKQLQMEILKQLLKIKNISFDWFDIIINLVWQSVDLVRPDVKHDNDSMDIRSYIKIKKLPGYSKTDCRIINGLVFTKNLAHKQMNNDIKNPKILLLKSSIEYQRTEEKMCSLEPIFAAESQYLKNYCSKLLLRHNPDILVVEKSVARIAQEIFLASNVSLVLNVKSTIMDKLCRFLQADPMYSIDDPIKKPKLGFCSKFHVDSHCLLEGRFKSLMFFEGTPTNLGCTILLSGASENELTIVKSLLRFMIYVAYNSKLEQSFILDKYADFNIKNTLFEIKNDENEFEKLKKNEEIIQKKTDEIKQEILSKTEPTKLNALPISIDESPLDEVKFKTESSDEEQDEKENEKEDKSNQDLSLKLRICEQHKEKNSINISRSFKLLIDDLILSCSPFVKYLTPFLLNENLNDSLKKYLPSSYMDYLKSNILLLDSQSSIVSPTLTITSTSNLTDNSNDLNSSHLHDFLLMHLTKSFDDSEIKKLYADYKSRGGIAASSQQNRRLILKKIENIDKNTNNQQIAKLKQFDCLDIFNRQHLAVLFVSQCETSPVYPNICHKPRIIDMKFYGENDMTLGSFLARNCFRNGYKCNNELCDTLIVFHTRSFVHADSKITIRMSIVPTSNQNSNQSQLTNQQANQINPQKDETNNQQLSISNLTQNKNQKLASGSTSSLNPILSITSLVQPGSKSANESSNSAINQPTQNITTSQQSNSQQISQQQQTVYDDINIFMWSVCKICNKSTKKIAMSPDTWSFSLAKFLELTFHAKSYHQFNSSNDYVQCKHSLFQDHYQYFRFKNIVTVFSTSKITIRTLQLPDTHLKILYPAKSRDIYIEEIKDLYEKGLSLFLTLVERLNTIKAINLNDKQMQKLDQFITQINNDQTLKNKIEKINLLLTNNGIGLHNSNEQSTNLINYAQIDLMIIDLKKYLANSAVNWNTKMNEFFKKSKFDDDLNQSESSTLEISKSFSNKSLQSNTTYKEDDQQSTSGKQLNETSESNLSLLNSDQISQIDSNDDHTKLPTPSFSIGKRLIANLIPSSAYQPLKIPFPDDEHYILSSDSSYCVNEKYLSSIAAFTLTSKEYKEFQSYSSKIELNKLTQQTQQLNMNNQNSTQEIDEFDQNGLNTSKSFGMHFELQFQDSTTKFYCKAYYAELFSRLRKVLMPNEEENYINSLFRCINWEAKGGKSNSQFRKTLDNRFILKEMSKQEVQSFLDFAPEYIEYIIDSVQNKKATALAKIYGAYRICMMKTTSIAAKAVKIDVIVMENLYYSKKCTQIFDLKGSERNRLINVNQQNNKQHEKDLVLLDENFLRWSFDNPIYIKPHSKFVLMKAIENDSNFLSKKFVMDYSLLFGYDQEANEISVGIIDYLRVFTWDKKVETYIKTIGGQGKMPTIVSPEVYKTRFINAIDRYFLDVPDQWYQDMTNLN